MELTYAKSRDDLEEIADLRGKIYSRRNYFEFYEERKKYQSEDPWYKPEHSRIIKENSKIVSHVSIIEKPVRFGPVVIKVAGIGDVFTIPSAQSKGYSRILMEDALQYMKEHSYSLTMLYGIPNFYHKFGYIESVKDYKLFFPVSKITKINFSYKIRVCRVADIPQMLKLYSENCQNCILTVDRNEDYFKRIVSDPKRIVLILDQSNEPVGYAHLVDDITKQFVVNEAITSNYETSQILAFEILQRAPKATVSIEIRMSPQQPFVQHIQHMGSEFHIEAKSEGDGNAMLAIVNLHKLLKALIPLFNKRLKFSEFYNDNYKLMLATEKEKLGIRIEKGKVQKIEKITSNNFTSLKANHRYFVRNIVGYWSIKELLDLTAAKIDDEKKMRLFSVLFPKEEPFMLPLDYF